MEKTENTGRKGTCKERRRAAGRGKGGEEQERLMDTVGGNIYTHLSAHISKRKRKKGYVRECCEGGKGRREGGREGAEGRVKKEGTEGDKKRELGNTE